MPTLEISEETLSKIREQLATKEDPEVEGLKYVLVRTYSAGVHYGYLASKDGKEVVLKKARRIWSWSGANTLSEIATSGLDVENSKISVAVSEITLTEAIEIITISATASAVLGAGKWRK